MRGWEDASEPNADDWRSWSLSTCDCQFSSLLTAVSSTGACRQTGEKSHETHTILSACHTTQCSSDGVKKKSDSVLTFHRLQNSALWWPVTLGMHWKKALWQHTAVERSDTEEEMPRNSRCQIERSSFGDHLPVSDIMFVCHVSSARNLSWRFYFVKFT